MSSKDAQRSKVKFVIGKSSLLKNYRKYFFI